MVPKFREDIVWPENEEHPYHILPEGIFECDISYLRQRFADEFGDSETRERIFRNFSLLLSECEKHNLVFTQWLDGSYVTSKQNPEDIDVCTFMQAQHLNNLNSSERHFVERGLNGREATKVKYSAHTFFVSVRSPHDPLYDFYEERRSYWQKWFGQTRKLRDPSNPDGPRLPETRKGFVAIKTGASAPQVETSR